MDRIFTRTADWFFKPGLFCLSPFFVLSFLLSVLFFLAWPQVDIWFSSLFWTPEKGFFLRDHVVFRLIYLSVEWISYGMGVFLLLWAFAYGLHPFVRRMGGGRFLCSALLLFVLGPGLVVNLIFKDHMGRARPAQIEAFGGQADFVPPFVFSRECERNCSFASGHASVAAWLLCLVLLFNGYGKKVLVFLAGLYFVLVGMGRIVQGGHFLSDVIFAFLLVYVVAALLQWSCIKKPAG
ncbi:phosphatase PAP2 family protein [Desulfobotulus sp. H1]|uniref:Phosphatase PAP2 family protein n=1 Tax=Desulfobotulus pelophilus TaxID=2823377 RepID=A0ABT3N9S5_9BACT|nr:phosphatase PAP2 family protein [Desulfobotulus pelophilus]MCW7754211.1 phosphatase PAP2 family protein [Desulfobotulus pelophilus]